MTQKNILLDKLFNQHLQPLEVEMHPNGHWEHRYYGSYFWVRAYPSQSPLYSATLTYKRGRSYIYLSYNVEWRWVWY